MNAASGLSGIVRVEKAIVVITDEIMKVHPFVNALSMYGTPDPFPSRPCINAASCRCAVFNATAYYTRKNTPLKTTILAADVTLSA